MAHAGRRSVGVADGRWRRVRRSRTTASSRGRAEQGTAHGCIADHRFEITSGRRAARRDSATNNQPRPETGVNMRKTMLAFLLAIATTVLAAQQLDFKILDKIGEK